MAAREKSRHGRALQVLTRIQRALVRRLSEYVLDNEGSLRQAAEGGEGYGFVLQQLDELFLTRLNLVERTIAELHKYPVNGTSRYRTLCFSVPRNTAEKDINSRLERIANARVLGIFASPVAARAEQPRREEDEAGTPVTDEDNLVVTVLYYGPSQPSDA